MMKMKIDMYPHPGSMNHGCEAIVRSTRKILGKDNELTLYSFSAETDKKYELDKCVEIIQTRELKRVTIRNAFYHFLQLINNNRDAYFKYRYSPVLKSNAKVVLSIGGDNYCYGVPKDLICINRELLKQGKKVILWGCSIDPEVLSDKDTLEDLKNHALIIARESITYDALKKAGLTNITLCSDPAFQLETKSVELPQWFIPEKTIGINVSPMVLRYENNQIGVLENYFSLIDYIIGNTDYQIAFIPHVTGVMNDDNETINILMDRYKSTGRVGRIEIRSCEILKGYISNCRFFIGARTHATIAAYSACVPTIVVGYSIKALGIAKDIFGTTNNYVVSAQKFDSVNDLKNAFIWLSENEEHVKEHLHKYIPQYKETAFLAAEKLNEVILNEKNN